MKVHTGMRVVFSPNYYPTMKGYLGWRRGTIVEVDAEHEIGLKVRLDKIGRERKERVKTVPPTGLMREEFVDQQIHDRFLEDPYLHTHAIPDMDNYPAGWEA